MNGGGAVKGNRIRSGIACKTTIGILIAKS